MGTLRPDGPGGASLTGAPPLRVGILSDTHGLLRPQAREFLSGSDYIVHAGDIGDAAILDALNGIAPTIAVRGNNDREAWGRDIRETELFRIGALWLFALHDLNELDVDPVSAGVRAVISGHSHKPAMIERGGVLFFNPGSCGPRRFSLPVSIGEILVSGERLEGRLVNLSQDA